MTSPNSPKAAAASKREPLRGTPVAQLGAEFVLVRTKKAKPAGHALPADRASHLVSKAGKALGKPGLPKEAVFTGSKRIYAFSIDTSDPTRLIREAPDGKRQTGRMVNGRFQPTKA
ncbi:MAG: hypothetical protein J0L58_16145 [Burkholderiales bacterium]|nr:hypothetical protein [Burkholderiales bacterium]